MSVAVIIGAQWGDEGKGKVVDYITEGAKLVVRYQGGNNAGHTVVVNGQKTALQLMPSGILRPGVRCLLASGVVVNPGAIIGEIEKLAQVGVDVTPERLGIASEVQLILPHHQAVDAAREARLGGKKIGTTGKGIGPAYEEAAARIGIRMTDLLHEKYLKELLEHNVDHANKYLEGVLGSMERFDVESVYKELEPIANRLKPYICDVSVEVNAAIKRKELVVFEGAQGAMLDISHGTYPFVTSSHTLAGFAAASAGIGPQYINDVIGICKAYCTRVGSGPFPSEDIGADGEVLRVRGHEFGTVTGRPRRCGWFDVPLMKRAARLNGITSMLVTKLDVLSGFKTIKLGVEYTADGKPLSYPPVSCQDLEDVQVRYEEMPGWTEDLTGVRKFEDLPEPARNLLRRIEELTECELGGFSIGPDRAQTIIMSPRIKQYCKKSES